jgi:polysaccharide deacetylase 2 family uncharacterized protein YibQ
MSPALGVAALVIGLFFLPELIERWLLGHEHAEAVAPLSQAELDTQSADLHASLDAGLLRLGLGERHVVRSSRSVERKDGLVWEARYQESYLPAKVAPEALVEGLRGLRPHLPDRSTVDVVQPDPLRVEMYATVGKARVRHELFRVALEANPEVAPGLHPNVAIVFLPGDGALPDPAALDAPMTVALKPFRLDTQRQARLWTQHGHEVLAALQLDADEGTGDYGQGGMEFLRQVLDAVPDRTGVLLVGDTSVSRDAQRMETLAAELADRRLMLVDHWLHPASLAVRTARVQGCVAAAVDMVLEPSESEDLSKVLRRAAQIAVIQGSVILAVRPDAAHLSAVERWVSTLRQQGFHFVFVHEALRDGPGNRRDRLSARAGP